MSASPMARQATETKSIPKKVYISDPLDMPSCYSSTPGGTLYSTTPGGTRIVYERSFLINLRESPISKTPPSYDIPEQIMKGSNVRSKPKARFSPKKRSPVASINEDPDQFQLEM